MGIAKYVDLSDLTSVKSFALEVLREFDRLDMLVLNAGIALQPFRLTEDGLESTFAVNHVANHLIFRILSPLLEKTADQHGRASVVSVSSMAHFKSNGMGLTEEEVNDEASFNDAIAYGKSKLANVLFAQEAANRFKKNKKNVFVNSCHPGFVDTEIAVHKPKDVAQAFGRIPLVGNVMEPMVEWVGEMIYSELKKIAHSTDQGALTQIWLAADPEIVTKGLSNSGLYYHPILHLVIPSSHASPSSDLSNQLWKFTDQILEKRNLLP